MSRLAIYLPIFIVISAISNIYAVFFIKSVTPTPELLYVRWSKDHDQSLKIQQVQTGATVILQVTFPFNIIEQDPLDNIKVFQYYTGGDAKIEDGAETTWFLVVLPAIGAELRNTVLENWLEMTEFDDSSEEALTRWLLERNIFDAFSVVAIKPVP